MVRLNDEEKREYLENMVNTLRKEPAQKYYSAQEVMILFPDFSTSAYTSWAKKLYGKTMVTFLTERGVLMTEEEKLDWALSMYEQLKERYRGKEPEKDIDAVEKKTKDMTSIRNWISKMVTTLDTAAKEGRIEREDDSMNGWLIQAGALEAPRSEDTEAVETAASSVSDELHVYRMIEQFDTDQMLKDVFGTTEDITVFPKDKKYKAEIGGKQFSARTYLTRSSERDHLDAGGGDAIEGIRTMLSKEEVEALHRDEKYSELVVYTPEFRDDLPLLSPESRKRRGDFFRAVLGMLLNDKGMADIIAAAPKKKDGTFARNRILRIATNAMTRGSNGLLYLYAKAKTDDSLSIYLEVRSVHTGELESMENDFISQNYEKYGLEKYLRTAGE